jgi:hypothetical protein
MSRSGRRAWWVSLVSGVLLLAACGVLGYRLLLWMIGAAFEINGPPEHRALLVSAAVSGALWWLAAWIFRWGSLRIGPVRPVPATPAAAAVPADGVTGARASAAHVAVAAAAVGRDASASAS